MTSLYAMRMQIEEEFRDLKNTRHGFGLRHCRSFGVERLDVALLIATLGTLILWLFGTAAKQKGLHFSFQANTVKTRNVLSVFMIGWQFLARNTAKFRKNELIHALDIITVTAAAWEGLC